MGVTRFRSVEDMPDHRWGIPGSPELQSAIARVWAFSKAAFPRQFPPGVYKHRTAADADAKREEWHRADFERLMRARNPGGG